MILREETTVQGLEGRIVAAVMSVEQEDSTGGNETSFQGNEISVGVEEVGVEGDPKINAVIEVDQKLQEESRDIRIVKEIVLDSIDENIRKAIDREIVAIEEDSYTYNEAYYRWVQARIVNMAAMAGLVDELVTAVVI